jgi:uncharacterized DUF497 family protein
MEEFGRQRGDDIRIISARVAAAHEREEYENQ